MPGYSRRAIMTAAIPRVVEEVLTNSRVIRTNSNEISARSKTNRKSGRSPHRSSIARSAGNGDRPRGIKPVRLYLIETRLCNRPCG